MSNSKILIVISWIILVVGFLVMGIGTYRSDIAIVISGIGLIGSFVGMFTSALNTKRQEQQDRPYLLLKINEERHNVLQIEVYNAGNNGAMVKQANLDRELYLMFADKTLRDRLEGAIIPAKDSVIYAYEVEKDWKKTGNKNPYVNISGTLKYTDFTGVSYENYAILNLSDLSGSLMTKKESIKRDHEIIKLSGEIEKMRQNMDKIAENYNK